MLNKIKLIILFPIFFLLSCQKIEISEDINFDNTLLDSLSINAEKKEIIISYDSNLNAPFIDHVMVISPTNRVISWAEDNISNFGTMNKLVIDIVTASVTRKEITTDVKVIGVMKKQEEYLYEMNINVNYILYSDDNQIMATTNAEVRRSTTSSKFISINERNHILDTLTLESLNDLSNKSIELLKIHMVEYVL